MYDSATIRRSIGHTYRGARGGPGLHAPAPDTAVRHTRVAATRGLPLAAHRPCALDCARASTLTTEDDMTRRTIATGVSELRDVAFKASPSGKQKDGEPQPTRKKARVSRR
jgi:hypothetical protein